MRTTNYEIKEVGIRFNGHYNYSEVTCLFDSFIILIPFDRISEFCRLFPEVKWENDFLHGLKGKYVRVTIDDDLKIRSIHHIVKDITYVV